MLYILLFYDLQLLCFFFGYAKDFTIKYVYLNFIAYLSMSSVPGSLSLFSAPLMSEDIQYLNDYELYK